MIKGVSEIKSIKVIKGEELVFEWMHLFHSVGKGASSPPRYVAVEYIGNPESKEIDYAIVGKGLTYDTGGLNLKPTNSIEDMYLDKAGACATLGALHGTIQLKLKKNIVFVVGLAENAIDANAYKPMDIIKSWKGLTVEIGNTDAEGRLVLADSLTYTQEKYNPKKIIDLATLTGACVVALGEKCAGYFSNNDEFVDTLLKSSQ